MRRCTVCDDEVDSIFIIGDARVCVDCRDDVMRQEADSAYDVRIARAVDIAWEKNG